MRNARFKKKKKRAHKANDSFERVDSKTVHAEVFAHLTAFSFKILRPSCMFIVLCEFFF